MDLIFTTTQGFEDIAVQELERLGVNVKNIVDGKIIGSVTSLEDIVNINLSARTIHRVCILLADEIFDSLEHIYSIAKNIDYSFISSEKTFEVRTVREGQHNFTSIDVNREVGRAVIDSYLESKNTRLRVNLDNPDISIKVWVVRNRILIGVDTTGDSLHRRHYRVSAHEAPLRSTIASAMILWSSWKPSETLCDPFCGSGTILIEGGYIGKNYPPNISRNNFLFRNIRDFEAVNVDELRHKLLRSVKERKLSIYGVDISPKSIKACVECLKAANLSEVVFCRVADALDCYEVDIADYIVTNPPYGIRSSSLRKALELYSRFSERLLKLSKKTIIVITPHTVFENYFEKLEKRCVMYGNLRVFVYKIWI